MSTPHDVGNDLAPEKFEQQDFEQQLDRLVDGELAEAERRAVLMQLDDTPHGWRRCALAFLEAQAWGEELRRVARSSLSDESAVCAACDAGAGGADGRRWRRRAGMALAMAASFLLIFGLGHAMRDVWRPAGGDLANSPGAGATDGNSQAVGQDSPPADEPTASQPKEAEPTRWGTVRFVLDGADEPQEVQLPVVQGPDAEQWLRLLAAEEAAWLREMEARGHRVRTERHLLPVQLQDGRRVVVPVDDVEITPAARRTYQ